jgi:hypothetical protein
VHRNGPLICAYALSLFGALFGIPNQPEHETHLAMAYHYSSDLFSLWDTSWHGGFSVAWHPPLLHVITAALGKMPGFGIERAYAAVTVLIAVGLVAAIGALAKEVSKDKPAEWIVATSPLMYGLLYPLAQTPLLLGLALAIAATASMLSFIRGGEWMRFVIATSGFTLALFAHPLALPLVLAGYALAWVRAVDAPRVRLVATALGLLAVLAVSGFGLAPFISATRTNAPMTVGKWSVWSRSGIALFSASSSLLLGGYALARARGLARLAAAASVLVSVLATLHVPPQIPEDKMWLFALVAAALAAGAVQPKLVAALAALSFVVSAYVLGRTEVHERRHRKALAEVAFALSEEGTERFRYLTLGLGNERLELSRRVRASTYDGGVAWLTRDASGAHVAYASLDGLSLEDDRERSVVEGYLQEADSLGLRWVISARSDAEPLLKANGFHLVAAWGGGVVLWTRDVKPLADEAAKRTVYVPWTLVPLSLSTLAALAALFTWVSRGRRQKMHQ